MSRKVSSRSGKEVPKRNFKDCSANGEEKAAVAAFSSLDERKHLYLLY